MMTLSRVAILAASLLAPIAAAAQQSSPSWFVPPAGGPAGARAPSGPRPAQPAARPNLPPPPIDPSLPDLADQQQQPNIDVPLPPTPELPPLPRGVTPPAGVIGVLGVPEVMHASTAAQQVEKIIGQRRDKLNEDAQKEQQVWRDMQQALVNQRATLSAEALRTRERELQERVTNAQKAFRDRNTIIQQAAQYSLGQIERTLIGVIREVAESRGMNLVLHRAQVALNVNDFDITDAVTQQLNKVLPSVQIPADGVSLAEMAKKMKTEPNAGAALAAPTPAAAPAAASATHGAPPAAPKH